MTTAYVILLSLAFGFVVALFRRERRWRGEAEERAEVLKQRLLKSKEATNGARVAHYLLPTTRELRMRNDGIDTHSEATVGQGTTAYVAWRFDDVHEMNVALVSECALNTVAAMRDCYTLAADDAPKSEQNLTIFAVGIRHKGETLTPDHLESAKTIIVRAMEDRLSDADGRSIVRTSTGKSGQI